MDYTTRYSLYDEIGRVRESKQQFGTENSLVFGYTYNKAGGLEEMTYPSGKKTKTCHDKAGRTSSVTNPTTSAPWATVTEFTAHGAPKQITLGNGLVETWNYNTRLQPESIQMGTLLTIQYGYGANGSNNGNIASQTITRGGWTATQAYAYDPLNRLKTANEGATWAQTYVYDRMGNRALTGAGYNPGNTQTPQVTADDPAFVAAVFPNNQWTGAIHNPAGNIINSLNRTYTYDGENRLKTVVANGGVTTSTEYFYDGEGRRVKKIVNDVETRYAYDTRGLLAAEYGPPSTDSGIRYITTDHLGSTRLLTDPLGAEKKCYDYLPFGEEIGKEIGTRPACHPNPTPTYPTLILDSVSEKFTGKERDAETGLDFFGARYMASAQGRFTSPDAPLVDQSPGDPQSWNLYSYVRNNPLIFTDPTGNDCVYVNSGGNGIDSINNQNTSKDCGKTGGYWVDGTVTQARFAHGSLILTGTTNGENRTSASYGLGPDPGLMALQQAGQLASPVADIRGIGLFYGASAVAGAALYAGGAFAGAELTTMGSLGSGGVLTNAQAGSIIGWGTSQAGAGATQALARGLTRAAVEQMKRQGLNRMTVEKLVQTYEQGIAKAAQTGIENAQLAPRLELMKKILSLW